MADTGTVFFNGRVSIFRNPAARPFMESDTFVFSAPWARCEDIPSAYRRAALDAARQEASTPYAWNERFGYLSPIPLHCGTGIEISVMAHLVGLNLLGEDMGAFRALEAMRQAPTCTNAEGINAVGRVHWITSAGTMGQGEDDFIAREKRLLMRLLEQETNAREKLLGRDRRILEDAVFRALAILSSARLMSRWELADCLSSVRFAAEAGLVEGISLAEIDSMFLKQLESGILRDEPRSLSEERERDREDGLFADKVNRRFLQVRMRQ